MVEGHFKLGLLLQMAAVAKLGLGFDQQEFPGLGMVRGVAGDTTHIVGRVDGVDCVHVLRTARVAGQALGVDFLCRAIFENKYFGYVSAAIDMG